MIKPDRDSRPSGFGEVPGVHAGQRFHRRTDLRTARVHLQPGRGIDACPDGARSIVFSGGYVDDVWDSENPIYTGEGGRDQQGRQVHDQIMVRGNLALRKNMEREIPVRVVRQIDLGVDFTYQYEGLYEVVRVRFEAGKDGPKVFRFALKRALLL